MGLATFRGLSLIPLTCDDLLGQLGGATARLNLRLESLRKIMATYDALIDYRGVLIEKRQALAPVLSQVCAPMRPSSTRGAC